VQATTALAIVTAAWLTIGTVAAVLMGNRGHDPLTWWVLGATLGVTVHPARHRSDQDTAVSTSGADTLAIMAGRQRATRRPPATPEPARPASSSPPRDARSGTGSSPRPRLPATLR
jgi:hypothetical protein